jgi:hypothetical protein
VRITSRVVEKAIKKRFPRATFFVRKRTVQDTIYFTIANLDLANEIKNVWYLNIEGNVYELAPAFYMQEQLEWRNQYVAKFKGFSKSKEMADITEILENSCNAKIAYRAENNPEEIIAKFGNNKDLNDAIRKTIIFGESKIKCIKKDETWEALEQKERAIQEKSANIKKNIRQRSDIASNCTTTGRSNDNPSLTDTTLAAQAETELQEVQKNRRRYNGQQARENDYSPTKHKEKFFKKKRHHAELSVATGTNNIEIDKAKRKGHNKDTTCDYQRHNETEGELHRSIERKIFPGKNTTDVMEIDIATRPTKVGLDC